MKEIFINENNLTSAYHSAIYALWKEGELSNCPDYNQKQKECSMTIVVRNPVAEPRISKLIIGGAFELSQYELEVLDGILDFKIGQGTAWEYTYHQRFAYQLPFIIGELKRNPDTRRAVINIRDFNVDSSNTHPACLQSIQYFIRNNKLDCCILFRSNDLPEATFFNMWALIKLQEKIAKELSVEVGSYTHRANSMHCYEKDFRLLEGYIKGIQERPNDLTYEYEGFYKDLMDEAVPQIMKNVAELKTHR